MIQKMISFFRLIRIGNILIMLATLILARFCLNDYLMVSDLFNLKFFYLIISTLLTGAAGYIINDYYDVKLDLVNKPEKVIVGNIIPRRWAMLFHLWFSGIAVVFGLLVNMKVALLIFLCAIMLWLYSVSFKKQFLIGNILVAAMSAFVIFILKIFDHNTPAELTFLYAAFAFGISLLREIIKDAEDMKGDSHFECKTLPIVLGLRKTKRILVAINIAFILFLCTALFFSPQFMHFTHDDMKMLYPFYLLLFVIIPLTVMIYMINKANVKSDFSRLSILLKCIMLTGILSMILLRF